mmetsp:Transcript_25329/g.45839  ORF Transcript_25329/g.45839 Transcript_25329/m.45839 type:complete len:208 (-) Transcript_25329:1141-1764(-)|eukprot:CAMPEP_0197650532 /NCGR_PEP_ID=MMETSP1338-20131121/30998_1 /TAXON_ID=43686 ORGANISM="Pelagodinium beii, Strain RCC1491" /NCGR_SAMPLE_ID=MMETSP1338 /ASSEMBLY_ACC=CAM_ASM_000754 /LENGTH=207 /DNA_ID=CAMNT_0043224961 /DNA_START=418 /DNA_END=1041 /DNA_ORIENTATION=+
MEVGETCLAIVGGGRCFLASLVLIVAAPGLLGRRPTSLPVGEAGLAVKRLRGAMEGDIQAMALGCLNGAGTADVALYLHLAVGLSASIFLMGKVMDRRKLDAVTARGCYLVDRACGVAAQGGQACRRASSLVTRAAPYLLRLRPSFLPVGIACIAVVGSMLFTTTIDIAAAPVLLCRRPASLPVREACVAVVWVRDLDEDVAAQILM